MMPTPSPQFFAQLNRAFQAPVIMGMSYDEADALKDRLCSVADETGLSAADRQILVQAESEINAGLSPTLQHPNDWGGDWIAEDNAGPQAETKSFRGNDDDGDWVGVGV